MYEGLLPFLLWIPLRISFCTNYTHVQMRTEKLVLNDHVSGKNLLPDFFLFLMYINGLLIALNLIVIKW